MAADTSYGEDKLAKVSGVVQRSDWSSVVEPGTDILGSGNTALVVADKKAWIKIDKNQGTNTGVQIPESLVFRTNTTQSWTQPIKYFGIETPNGASATSAGSVAAGVTWLVESSNPSTVQVTSAADSLGTQLSMLKAGKSTITYTATQNGTKLDPVAVELEVKDNEISAKHDGTSTVDADIATSEITAGGNVLYTHQGAEPINLDSIFRDFTNETYTYEKNKLTFTKNDNTNAYSQIEKSKFTYEYNYSNAAAEEMYSLNKAGNDTYLTLKSGKSGFTSFDVDVTCGKDGKINKPVSVLVYIEEVMPDPLSVSPATFTVQKGKVDVSSKPEVYVGAGKVTGKWSVTDSTLANSVDYTEDTVPVKGYITNEVKLKSTTSNFDADKTIYMKLTATQEFRDGTNKVNPLKRTADFMVNVAKDSPVLTGTKVVETTKKSGTAVKASSDSV